MKTHAVLRKGRENEPAILMVDIIEGLPYKPGEVLLSVSFREFTVWGRDIKMQREEMELFHEI